MTDRKSTKYHFLEKLGWSLIALPFIALLVYLVINFYIWFIALIIGILILVAYSLFDRLTAESDIRTQLRAIGKNGIFVYSDSPNWKRYVESEILPRFGEKLIPLNWSNRRSWDFLKEMPLEVQIFKRWKNDEKFGPIAIIFPRKGQRKIISFKRAFVEFKHGKPTLLLKLLEELSEAIEDSDRSQ